MLSIVTVVCVVSGAVVAYISQHYPPYTRSMEMLGGILLISGLAILGFGLRQVIEAVNF